MTKDLRKKIAELQTEIDNLNETKSNRVATEISLLGVGLVIGFVLGIWATGII